MRCFDHIAKLIKEKRKGHPQGYSQSELSSLLGYKNGQFISNVERGLCNIPLKMLVKVSHVLGISMEEIKTAVMSDHERTIDSYLGVFGNNVESLEERRRVADADSETGNLQRIPTEIAS